MMKRVDIYDDNDDMDTYDKISLAIGLTVSILIFIGFIFIVPTHL